MIDFLKNSFRELKHVVWPTRKETKKYFIIVLNVLVVFGIYLFLANTIFSKFIFTLKSVFNKTNIENTIGIDGSDITIGTEVIGEDSIVDELEDSSDNSISTSTGSVED